MYITVVTSENHCETIISTEEGNKRVLFLEGEPDFLSEAEKINGMLSMAYDAGKYGERLEIRHKKEEND